MDRPVRNILLDIGGVLLHLHFERVAQKLKAYTDDAVDTLIASVMGTDKNRFETGLISEQEFHTHVNEHLENEIPIEVFRDMWCDIFSENHEMTSLIEVLKHTHNLVLASNTNAMHFDFIVDEYPFLSQIQHRALSYELGVMKPDAEFFVRTLRQFRLQPQETLLIDDTVENVVAAQDLGIRGIVYRNYDELLDELSVQGVALKI